MATETGKGASAMAAEKGKRAAAAEKGKGGRPNAAETDADDGKTVKLKSSDEQIFEVPAKVAKQFKIIADVVDKGCCAGDTLPLPNVDSSTLAKVVEYCENHLRMNAQPDARSSWDKEFVSKLAVSDLYDLINAANYLDYERLLDLICKAFADLMAGKTVEQIRVILGIENDYTPEEEAAMYAENAWIFQD